MSYRMFRPIFAIVPALFIASPVAGATGEPFTDGNLKTVMNRIEDRADVFENRLERTLETSTMNGSDLEDRLNRWAAVLEDAVDDMAENYQENDSARVIDKLENALIVGSGINRVMLRKELAGSAESDWRILRSDLNTVAQAFHRPVLANLTLTAIVPVDAASLGKADVTHVMEKIEAATDRFEDKFRDSIQHSTSNMTDREYLFDRWADSLEDVSDNMLEEYKERDHKEFSSKLQDTLVAGAAINRIMLRSDLTEEAHREWTSLRKDLNKLATAFGHPVLPDMVAHVRTASK